MKRDTEDERTTVRRQDVRDTAVMKSPPVAVDLSQAALARELDAPGRRYLVRQRLGLGGMGEVNDTFDVKIGREIAMKTMLPQHPSVAAGMQERFLREARVQALLEHPAIVPVYDIGFAETGLPFFTMKRVRGETLLDHFGVAQHERLTIRKKGLHRLLSAFVTVCLAVDYAHQRGVVHRDLKPENIMLGPHGEVYVLDWGLAKIAPSGPITTAAESLDAETRPGEMVGTPGYMPPEQVLGQHQDVDARSDVYALGAILFELLHDRRRHEGAGAVSILESTMDADRPAPVPAGDAPPELHAIAVEATCYRREDRPASARALAERVERYLDGDRDDGLRRRLADERVAEATRDHARATHGSAEEQAAARASAMHHAGRALALAPEHKEAEQIILRLLAAPPATTPPAVRRELAALDQAHLRDAMRDNALRSCSWLFVPPFVLLMGIRVGWLAGAIFIALVACAVASLVLWQKGIVSIGARLGLYAATMSVFATMAGLFGPFILVPVLMTVNTLLFGGVQWPRKDRPLIAVLGIGFFLAPVLLEGLGLVPRSLGFQHGTLEVLPRIADFPPTITFVFLMLATAFGIAAPMFVTGRLRDALRAAEKRLVVQKWQLSQLSPAASP